jgi:alpha-tubulin suppressor-like RCC1 family protein
MFLLLCSTMGDQELVGGDASNPPSGLTARFLTTLPHIPFLGVRVTQAGFGDAHLCLLGDGAAPGSVTLQCQGYNQKYQLGSARGQDRAEECYGCQAGDMAAIEAFAHDDGFGTTDLPQLVAAGGQTTCIVFTNGRMRCFGYAGSGLGGQDTADDIISETSTVPFIDFGTTFSVLSVAVSNEFACALFTHGRVKCFGQGSNLVLARVDGGMQDAGSGPGVQSITSVVFVSFQDPTQRVTQVIVGEQHACALFTNARVVCWGGRTLQLGQLGYDFATVRCAGAHLPAEHCVAVSALGYLEFMETEPVVQIEAGFSHTCALMRHGRVGKQQCRRAASNIHFSIDNIE